MAALAICAVTAALLRSRTDTQAPAPVLPGQSPPAEFGMIPLTVPETGRLLIRPPPPGSAAHWLGWRRSPQHRPGGCGIADVLDHALPRCGQERTDVAAKPMHVVDGAEEAVRHRWTR